jgi:3-deoxy-D-manno-octulosonate 8-phosphate phosphatase (KDO 8-P phosphatase)
MSELPALLPARSESGRSVQLVVFDFDGVFTDNAVFSDGEGNEWVRCSRSDGLGLAKLRKLAIPNWVLSTETHPVVGKRCAKLQIPVRQGLAVKEEELRKLAAELRVPVDATVYVGNDINDLGCLKLAGIPIVVADAHPDVISAARYRTRRPGGFGAVREVCDWISASALEEGA